MPKKVNCEDEKKRRRRWTKGHSIESTNESTNRSNSDIIALTAGINTGIHTSINDDINSHRISSANGGSAANGSKLRRTTSTGQQANGRTGRLIRQFERQLEFRVRPRTTSEYKVRVCEIYFY